MTLHNGKSTDPALTLPQGVITYTQLDTYIGISIKNFRQSGIRPGMHIGLYQPTSARYIVSMLALIQMGAIACPISTRLPESGLQEALNRLNAQAIFYEDRGIAHGNSSVLPILFDAMNADIDQEESETLSEDRHATIIFTSGSSGTPKAAVHSLSNHIESAQASSKNILLAPGDTWLLSLPLFHVGGLGVLFRCLQAGAAVVIPDSTAFLDETLNKLPITHISLVSTQLYRLLQNKESTSKLASMKAVLMGGSAMPSQLIQRALNAQIPIHTSYGMTEMTTQITCTPQGASAEQLRTSGRPLINDNCRISDDGEIQAKGPTLFQGYLRHGTLDLPLTEDGWFPTGDRGEFDNDGHLQVTGRTDNMFISGGENIQPEEIEDTLCQLEGILQAVVIAVEEEEFGKRPVAFIRIEGDYSEEGIKASLRKCMADFKIPVRILPWPEDMPEGMKVDRSKFLVDYVNVDA